VLQLLLLYMVLLNLLLFLLHLLQRQLPLLLHSLLLYSQLLNFNARQRLACAADGGRQPRYVTWTRSTGAPR
jgi:hypothetical protein